MKVTIIYSLKTKEIVFWSLNKFEALEFFEGERLDLKYYGIKDIKSQIVEDYYTKNMSRSDFDRYLKKELARG